MKSIVCKEPFNFNIEDKQKPIPAKEEALIKVKRVGICGTDLHAFKGEQPYFSYPRILGHELSGEIIEINSSDDKFKVNDHVMINPYRACNQCPACKSGKTNCCEKLELLGIHIDGGMMEYITVPLNYLYKAENMSLDELAIIECLSIGAHAVKRANIQEKDRVLVIGAGPIGLSVMKFAKLAKGRVTALDINSNRLEFSKNWASIDFTVNLAENPVEQIKNLNNGELPTIVFDATGNKDSMSSAIQYIANGGKLIFVGVVKDKIMIEHSEFHRKEISLLCSRNATDEDFKKVIKYMDSGDIDSKKFISHRTNFENFTQDFPTYLLPKSGVIKAMLEFD